MNCPACDAPALEDFHDGGAVPVFVNVLHGSVDAARAAPRGALRLGVCHACGLVHNVAFEPALVAYAPGYENSLHGSPAFDRWARGAAATLVERHDARGGAALDIGGGRGEFMALLIEAGVARGLVVDPSAPDTATEVEPIRGGQRSRAGVTIERRTFRPSDVTGDTRLVVSRHVLEHLARPAELLRAILAETTRVRAGVYIEVPNGLFTLRDLGVWDLIYEHCSYFTPSALTRLFERAGADSVGAREAFHAQFLSAEHVYGAPRSAHGLEVTAPSRIVELCRAFAAEYAALLALWSGALAARRHRRIALWGTGSKGATFLNVVPGAERIACAVDVNPLKHGLFVAGSGHLIASPTTLVERGIEEIIVLNPAYADEICRMARELGLDAEIVTVERVREEAA